MITIFTTPKDFKGIFEVIQINAFKSWRKLSPEIQIIIFGDSKGAEKAATDINAEYIPQVKCSPLGTPFISDMFSQADKISKFPILVFINSDIILPENFMQVINIVTQSLDKFLLVGHRWDIDIDNIINYDNKVEYNLLWEKIKTKSKQHRCTGIDYFIYKRYQWINIPNFIIGRDGYDNWIIWKARRKLLPVVDATEILMVAHQNHPYNYSKINEDSEVLLKDERKHNKEIYTDKTLNLLDCTHKVTNGKVFFLNFK